MDVGKKTKLRLPSEQDVNDREIGQTMHKFTAMLAVVVSLVLVGVTSQGELMPPERPTRFRSPGDLRRYLKALNEYYAIVGRPRFGRSASNKKTVGGRSGWTKE